MKDENVFDQEFSFRGLLGSNQKSDNLQFNMLDCWVDWTSIPPSDGPIIILIDWE